MAEVLPDVDRVRTGAAHLNHLHGSTKKPVILYGGFDFVGLVGGRGRCDQAVAGRAEARWCSRIPDPVLSARSCHARADALRRRGVADLPASLAAEAGIAIFKIAFERWTGNPNDQPLSDWIRECAEEIEVVTTGRVEARR
jgi:hypothetical protein